MYNTLFKAAGALCSVRYAAQQDDSPGLRMQSGRRRWKKGQGGTLEGVPPQVPSPSVKGQSGKPG